MVLFFSVCGQMFTKFGRHIGTGVIAVCHAVFRSTTSCFNPEIFAMKLQNSVAEN